MSFTITGSGQQILMSTDNVTLKMLCVQMAASIIDGVEQMPITGKPSSGAGLVLTQYVNWADHGYLNHLQAMVELLYTAIPVLSQIKYLFEHDELRLIKESLVAYQVFKTSIVEKNRALHGPDFGSATGFVIQDWTDRNNLL